MDRPLHHRVTNLEQVLEIDNTLEGDFDDAFQEINEMETEERTIPLLSSDFLPLSVHAKNLEGQEEGRLTTAIEKCDAIEQSAAILAVEKLHGKDLTTSLCSDCEEYQSVKNSNTVVPTLSTEKWKTEIEQASNFPCQVSAFKLSFPHEKNDDMPEKCGISHSLSYLQNKFSTTSSSCRNLSSKTEVDEIGVLHNHVEESSHDHNRALPSFVSATVESENENASFFTGKKPMTSPAVLNFPTVQSLVSAAGACLVPKNAFQPSTLFSKQGRKRGRGRKPGRIRSRINKKSCNVKIWSGLAASHSNSSSRGFDALQRANSQRASDFIASAQITAPVSFASELNTECFVPSPVQTHSCLSAFRGRRRLLVCDFRGRHHLSLSKSLRTKTPNNNNSNEVVDDKSSHVAARVIPFLNETKSNIQGMTDVSYSSISTSSNPSLIHDRSRFISSSGYTSHKHEHVSSGTVRFSTSQLLEPQGNSIAKQLNKCSGLATTTGLMIPKRAKKLSKGDFIKFSSTWLIPGKPHKWKKVRRRVGNVFTSVWEAIPSSCDETFLTMQSLLASGTTGSRRTGRTTRAVAASIGREVEDA